MFSLFAEAGKGGDCIAVRMEEMVTMVIVVMSVAIRIVSRLDLLTYPEWTYESAFLIPLVYF